MSLADGPGRDQGFVVRLKTSAVVNHKGEVEGDAFVITDLAVRVLANPEGAYDDLLAPANQHIDSNSANKMIKEALLAQMVEGLGSIRTEGVVAYAPPFRRVGKTKVLVGGLNPRLREAGPPEDPHELEVQISLEHDKWHPRVCPAALPFISGYVGGFVCMYVLTCAYCHALRRSIRCLTSCYVFWVAEKGPSPSS